MIKSYLSDRWQHVIINRNFTDNNHILTCVPQVSKIEPFFLFLNKNVLDITSGDNRVTNFEDDSTLINAGKTFFLKTTGYKCGFGLVSR